jgi:hypothetical protein
MQKKEAATRSLAIAGTILVWMPILAPIALSLVFRVARGWFRIDYLMPAELFPLAALGGGLLLWATRRARARVKLIGWSLGLAMALLVGGQALAVVTGLASGEAEPAGLWWALVVLSLAVYTLSVVTMGVGGILLLRDVFSHQQPTTEVR